ncbi:hypothetical protein M407DRAFT_26343, partial [Tulasnella calospora MUT 4182]
NLPSTPCGKTYSIIVAVASGDPDPEQYLHGVEGDLPFVFDELNARTTDTPRVITDVNCESWESRAQVVPANLQHIKLSFIQKASIEEMGQALKQGDLCYVYIGGHAEMDPDGTSCVMPLSKDERLHGNVSASWLKDAAGGGGTIIVFADICHSSAFLKLPNIYEIDAHGLLYCTAAGGKEYRNIQGQLIVVSSTECGQLARTIEITKGVYAGWHGFFTWLLFKYFKESSPQVDIDKLLLYLRVQCARHPEKPRPQVSATMEGLGQLPIRPKRA